jgi:hypothetical protein
MCGSTITKWQRARHKKTKKCMSAQNCVWARKSVSNS